MYLLLKTAYHVPRHNVCCHYQLLASLVGALGNSCHDVDSFYSFVVDINVCCTEWPKISENMVIYDSVIVDSTHLNLTYLSIY